MRLGSIAIAWRCRKMPLAVMQAATQFLEQRGVDLIIPTNLSRLGRRIEVQWLSGNAIEFHFGASRPLAELLSTISEQSEPSLLNRGDGDGPVNL